MHSLGNHAAEKMDIEVVASTKSAESEDANLVGHPTQAYEDQDNLQFVTMMH